MVTDERLENIKGRVVGLAKMERWQKSELERQTPDHLPDGIRQMKIKMSETLISEYEDLAEALTELIARRKANEPMPERKSRAKAKGMSGKPTASAKQRKFVKWIAETLKIEMPAEMTYENCNKFIRANKPAFDRVRADGKKQTESIEPDGVAEQFEDPNQSPFQ